MSEKSEPEVDELDSFIVDENEPIDKSLLATILKPYVKSIGKNKVIDYTDKFGNLSAWAKILVFLCCRKVMIVKNIIEVESCGPKEISSGANISLESAKQISQDKNLKKVTISLKGEYYIPNYKLRNVKALLVADERNP
jgi:hypothetical protein